MEGYHCVRMEDFGARDAVPDEFCRRKVLESDIFVAIIGHLYGSVAQFSEKSYVEQEYDAAVAAGKPRLLFLAPDNFPIPANLIEPDDKREKQKLFRDRINCERIRDSFASPEDLAWRIVRAIHNWASDNARTDLDSIISRYHREVQAGAYDTASSIYVHDLEFILYYKLGETETCVELLSMLFPDGEERPTRISRADYQAGMLHALAICYYRLGQHRRALRLLERATRISEDLGHKDSIAAHLSAIGVADLSLGRLAEAERYQRQCLDMYRARPMLGALVQPHAAPRPHTRATRHENRRPGWPAPIAPKLCKCSSFPHAIRLPAWMYPGHNKPPLTYHQDKKRWKKDERGVVLRTVSRDQEFVLDADYYPKAYQWLAGLFKAAA